MQDFRQLLVWQHAHRLTLAIKQVVRVFPKSGYSDLKSQILRAADSMVSNIVEGCGAATRKEFARYLDISIKSASEVDYRLQLARDDGCLHYEAWRPLSDQVVRIRKMLFSLRRAVIAADRPQNRGGGGAPNAAKPNASNQKAAKPKAGKPTAGKPMTDDKQPNTHNR